MFESTLSAQGLSERERKLAPLSVAVAGHLALVAALVGVTAMIVPPIADRDPPESPVFVSVVPPPDLGSPRSGALQPKKGADASKPKRSVVPQPPVQPLLPPVETPAALSITDESTAPDGPDGAGDGNPGLPNGTGSDLPGSGGNGEEGDGGGGTSPVPFSAEMVRPVRLVKVEPVYPEVARIARLGGRVTVQAVIGLDGNVESAEILSSTSPLFNDAARSAVLKWRHRPALMNGKPVRIYFTVVVDFSVR